MERKLRNHEVAKILGVSTQSVRRYVNEGRLECDYTPSGQRVFTKEQLEAFTGLDRQEQEVYAFYVRSSNGDKTLLNNQEQALTTKYGTPVKVYSDRSSGLNSKRKGLSRLLDDAKAGDFNRIAVTQQDRLTRFGFEFLVRLFEDYGVKIVILNEAPDKTLEQELLQDFMSLIASFSGKFYRIRGKQQQRQLLEKAQQELK